MHETVRQPALQSPDRPDPFFAFVAGLYVALLVAPALVAAMAVALPADPSVLYLSFLAALTVVTAVSTVAIGRLHGLPQRLGASRLVWMLAVVPIVAAATYFVSLHLVGGVGIAGLFLSLVGFVVGVGLVAMSRTRYVRAAVDTDTVRVEWKAGWPQPLRTRLQVGAAALYFGGMALLFGGEFVGLGSYGWLGAVAFVPGGAAMGWGQPQRYRLSAIGIDRSNHIHRRLYEWDAFESFSVTDDAVILRRSGPRPAFRCWREEIDDEAELLDALDDHLPRA
ncbi:hypothetical protein BV210_13755 [Halorientalis sp. IM1011]|uniref:hypothetical protein n=1 Tax=Halorientalis sp. IM1011 TaxID=1932360 RepID=UPI00097CD453|nr:hypothetical protein [Halorientalis sp. IM1011]AQL43702.1 hypothetical protein BV210_13755 [Halorientalis sp. IM1011]